jgi:hypothetical protein
MAGKSVASKYGIRPGDAAGLARSKAIVDRAVADGASVEAALSQVKRGNEAHLRGRSPEMGKAAAAHFAKATPKTEPANAAAKPGPEKRATVKRAPNFADTKEYVVTLPNGKKARIFRDTSQFSYPVWHRVGDDSPSGIGFTKEEAVQRLERTIGGVK